MSLTWSLEKVVNSHDLYEPTDDNQDLRPKPLTERIIFLTMEVDLGEVTEKNVDAWLVRMAMMKRCGWSPRTEITRADIERHVGLRTNVKSTNLPAFRSKLIRHIEIEARDEVRRGQRA